MKRSKQVCHSGEWKSEVDVESVRLCLFDGTIDKLGAGVAGRMEAERAGVGWHGSHCGHCDSCRRGS